MGDYINLLRGTLVIVSHSVAFHIITASESRIRHPLRFWILFSVLMELFVILTLFPFGMTTFVSAVNFLIFLIAYSAAFIMISGAANRRRILFIFYMYASFFMLAASTSDLLSKLFFDSGQIAMIVIRTLFSLLFIIALVWKLKDMIMKATSEITDEWGTLLVFSFICCLCCATVSLTMYFIGDIRLHLVILATTAVFFISAFSLMLRMIRLLNEKNETKQIYQQQRLLERELEAEEEFIRDAKRYRHDIRHHLSALRGIAEEGDIESIKEYLRESEKLFEDKSLTAWCENKTVNSLLRMNAKRCASLGIRYAFNVVLPKDIAISGPELASVFGNLLENAIDNMSSETDAFVICNACIRNGSLLAEIRNRFTGKIVWQDGLPLSTKKDGGIGLKSVRFTVENRGGMFRCSEEDQQFAVQLVIPL